MTAKPVTQPRIITVQDGARLHYAVPVAMERAGLLHTMFAEWFDRPGSVESMLALAAGVVKPELARKLRSRSHTEIPRAKVKSNPLLVLKHHRATKRFSGQPYHAECSRLTGQWVQRNLSNLQRDGANLLHGYVRNIDPGLCARAREAGYKTLGDQIIASAVEEIVQLKTQHERFPGWEQNSALRDLELYAEYEQQTWQALDHVLCPSPYVREHLIAQGVPEEHISLLPYPIDARSYAASDRSKREKNKPMTVGFVGAVNLRKGAPYFLQVAQRFDPQRVKFVMVGKVQLHEKAESQFAPHVQLIGAVPRSEVSRWMEQFDVFLFPSTCEGSAGAVMEAMASALPIITSGNSGSVLRDGQDGFVVSYDDVDGMTQRIEQLASDHELRQSMGRAARARAESLDLNWYSRELAAICRRVLNPDAG